MEIPVILTASSGSQLAQSTYQILETNIRNNLKRCHHSTFELFWGYSSRVVARERRKDNSSSLPEIGDVVRLLRQQGHTHAILQSLHLIVGHEFHQLLIEATHAEGFHCLPGRPLLTTPADFNDFARLIETIAQPYPEHAILLIGHGTRHASWPIYLGLEQMLQAHFGKRVYVGVVEHYPDSGNIEQRLQTDGHARVLVIPFFLIPGIHFSRDIIGTDKSAWANRLTLAGFEVEMACREGLGGIPEVGAIFARHILEATHELMT